jgi:hypothetical protein
MARVVLRELNFVSYLKISAVWSAHLGFILAVLFLVTNSGRTVSFGTFYFFDGRANWAGFVFLLIGVTATVFGLSVVSFWSTRALVERLRGLRGTGDVDADVDGVE